MNITTMMIITPEPSAMDNVMICSVSPPVSEVVDEVVFVVVDVVSVVELVVADRTFTNTVLAA